jgi:hypothetical protein
MIWLDFQAKSGKLGEYVQEGEHIILAQHGALVLYPGLFAPTGSDGQPLDDDGWEPWASHSEVQRMLGDGTLRLVSDDLREYQAPGALRDLISRTTDRAGLEHLRRYESAKPRGHGQGRQDADVINLLDRADRLARSPISTLGMEASANGKAPLAKTGGRSK